jgi:hypothetical protein
MLQRCRAGRARRLSVPILIAALGFGAVPTWSQAQNAGPDALLAIDLNRSTVIERIVMQWGGLLLPWGTVLDAGQLRTRLSGLRADRLLAASLAGTQQGLQQVLTQADAATRRDARLKSLGDAAVDLTYTPLTPCRIIDTRNAVGPLQPGVTRTEVGYTATTFAGQGGASSNCGIPAGVAALALNVVAVSPANLGFIKLWPANAAQPNASTINYDPTTTNIASGTIVPVDGANNNSFNAESPAQVQMVVDVVGYFAAPSGNGGTFFKQGGNAFGVTAMLGTSDPQPFSLLMEGEPVMRYVPGVTGTNAPVASPNLVGGLATNAVGAFSGQTVAGGGKDGANCLDSLTNTGSRSCGNQAANDFASVGGGYGNLASGLDSTVAGGEENSASGVWAVVGGGYANVASGPLFPTVAGGANNTASQEGATVGGGDGNSAGFGATVAGGDQNNASGLYAAIPGGQQNVASGAVATVAGGSFNTASGAWSFAAGNHASANQNRCVVFGLWSTSASAQCLGTASVFKVMGDNGFSVDYHAPVGGGGDRWLAIGPFTHGGVVPTTIITWNGAYLSDAGVWVNASSSKTTKIGFEPVDVAAVLARVVRLPITTWRYKSGDGDVRHMGPMAEDFWDAFGIGYGNQTIADLDARGVEFAAIQGLNQIVQEKDAEIEAQQRRIAELEARMGQVESLRNELDAVKRALSQLTIGGGRVAMHETQ